MCGRATLTEPDLDRVAEALEAEPTPALRAAYCPRWNAAPGNLLCVALPGHRLDLLRWGLPRAGGLLVNLRAETFSPRHGERCAVPVDGFYEWTGPKRARRPIWFHRTEGGLLALAAVARQTPQGLAFAVLTVPSTGRVAEIHDRMPALLPLGDAEGRARLAAWLAGAAPPPGSADPALLAGREVSARVNSVSFDEPACLAPEAPLQLSLGDLRGS
jgi:putative SOS response-associated peptidase YedK